MRIQFSFTGRVIAMLLTSLALFAFSPEMNDNVRADASASYSRSVAHQATPVQCTVNVTRLNIRSGPGAQYNVVTAIDRGAQFVATERSADNAWVLGSTQNYNGWTAARFLDCAAAVASLPLATGPALSPAAQPTTAPATPVASQPAANTPQRPLAGGGVVLLQPVEARLSGRQTFRWQTNVELKPNQGYELVFWEGGQDPIAKGFGLVKPTTETSVNVDLDKLRSILSQLTYGKEYQWGVLLVQLHPYRRLQLLGSGHRFLFATPESAGGGGIGERPPTPPPPPKAPPK
jgi:uncharacterized protein YraI